MSVKEGAVSTASIIMIVIGLALVAMIILGRMIGAA